MGWARTVFLGDYGTQMNVVDAMNEIASMKSYLKENYNAEVSNTDALRKLVKDNQEMKLCIATLAKLLIAKQIITHEELSGFADIIDNG